MSQIDLTVPFKSPIKKRACTAEDQMDTAEITTLERTVAALERVTTRLDALQASIERLLDLCLQAQREESGEEEESRL